MNYISISQAANKFDVSERYVRKLCTDGLITGAAKIGQTWIIPENATIAKKQNINIVLGGDDNVGFEIASYLIERGENVCFISKSEKQILNALKCLKTENSFLFNADASNEEELLNIRNKLQKYNISKIIFSENNARFEKVENNDLNMIKQNFRGPIYSSVLVMSIFYPLMSKTTIIAVLHEKATTIGLTNESVFSAASHGMNGFFDSVLAAVENDDKISGVLKAYTGAVESEFWYTEDSKNVLKMPSKNRIPPSDLAKIIIDSANSKNTLGISEIHVRRIKEWKR